MAKLLCITPWPGSKSNHGRIPAALIPRWSSAFDEIGVWSIHGGPGDGALPFEVEHQWAGDEPLENRLPELGEILNTGGWTHIWVMGDLQFLLAVTGMGLFSNNLPNALLCAYAIVDSPFIDTKYLRLPELFDFFVLMSDTVRGALLETVAELGPQMGKNQFKASMRTQVIYPGVDRQVFRPLDVHKGEPSYEEIRESMFGDRLNSQDLLVMVSGQKLMRKGLPQVFSIVRELKSMLGNGRRVKLYLHMYCRADEQRPLRLDVLAAGCGLNPLTDILYGDGFFITPNPTLPDEDLNLIYNAADLVLSTDLRNGWCFTTTEAMAAGTLVAAPDEHTWVNVVAGCGVELPCTEFGWSPWSRREYVRAVDPYQSAMRIAEVVNDPDETQRLQQKALEWAAKNPQADWDRCADEWAELFGL